MDGVWFEVVMNSGFVDVKVVCFEVCWVVDLLFKGG